MRVLITVVVLVLAVANLQAQDPDALRQQIEQIQQQLDALKGGVTGGNVQGGSAGGASGVQGGQQQRGGATGGSNGGAVSLRPMETGRSRDLKRGGDRQVQQQPRQQQGARYQQQPVQQRGQQEYYGGGAPSYNNAPNYAPSYNNAPNYAPSYNNVPNYNPGYNTGYSSIYDDNWNDPRRGSGYSAGGYGGYGAYNYNNGGGYNGGGLYNRVAIKTNAAYWALTTVNLGVEFALGGKSTMELSGGINRWGKAPKGLVANAAGGAQDAAGVAYKPGQRDHVLGKAEIKFWFADRFDGHFLGVQTFYTDYDIYGVRFPLLFEDEMRYDGTGFGVGLTYGYHWRWSPRWGLDMSFGAGMVSLNYDKRLWDTSSPEAGSVAAGEFKKTYFGPTAIGLKLFFMIK